MSESRRLAGLGVTPELLMFMGSGRFEVAVSPLPEDVQFVGGVYDADAHPFIVIVESASFAPVPAGGMPPLLTPPVISRLE